MISVSFLKSKYDKKTTIRMIDESSADMIHVDLMDGDYVSEKNFTIDEVIDDLKSSKKPLDIHLMVSEPIKYIPDLAKLNVKTITIHLDIKNDVLEVLDLISDYNILRGIAINPQDDITCINPYLDFIDYVLIMSVFPGKGGQKFIPSVMEKVKYLNDLDLLVGIDGGINNESIKYLKGYRIDNIISGSFICMSDDYDKQIEILKNNI